jgi:uncharacterized membrane protein
MNFLFKIFLAIHILGGSIGLLSGTLVMFLPKGNLLHRKIGKIFFVGMCIAGLVSLVLAILHPSRFLFLIGVFTLYMVIAGKQYLSFQNPNYQAKWFNWLLTIIMLCFGATLIFLGIRILPNDSFAWVYLSFGFISLNFVRTDYFNFKNLNTKPNFALTGHLQRMCGAYIASLTAFLVVNVKFLPSLVIWLLPTIVITPLIFIWSKKIITQKNSQS